MVTGQLQELKDLTRTAVKLVITSITINHTVFATASVANHSTLYHDFITAETTGDCTRSTELLVKYIREPSHGGVCAHSYC